MNGKTSGGIDRRGVIRLAIAAAIVPAMSSTHAGAQAVSGSLISPPADPMVYCRTVVRDMADGSAFRVQRAFTVEFQRTAGGFAIHGRQSQVTVDAPGPLARFAELERARDESGLFPLSLDPMGHILSPQRDVVDGDEMDRAVGQAVAAISRQQLAHGERATLESFVAAVHSAGQIITAHLPVDLFAPAGGPRRSEHHIPLPGGGGGRVFSMFEGQLDSATGLMREALREVVTEVEGQRRTTRESWTLGHA